MTKTLKNVTITYLVPHHLTITYRTHKVDSLVELLVNAIGAKLMTTTRQGVHRKLLLNHTVRPLTADSTNIGYIKIHRRRHFDVIQSCSQEWIMYCDEFLSL